MIFSAKDQKKSITRDEQNVWAFFDRSNDLETFHGHGGESKEKKNRDGAASRPLFVIAGEASGDILGGQILEKLCLCNPSLRIVGIGGPFMEKAGNFHSIIPMHEFSHMGFSSIFLKLPRLIKLFFRILVSIKAIKPCGLLTIDAPELCLRIGRRMRSVPRIHCVAPSVWAWRPRRAITVPRAVDHLLCLFPFELPYFNHMKATFVGHPVLQRTEGKAQRFWHTMGCCAQPLLCLLPGSRLHEIKAFLPIFLQTYEKLKETVPQLMAVCVTTQAMLTYVKARLPEGIALFTDEQDKADVFTAATVALAASGTVSLELAFYKTPMVIGYKVGPISGWLARWLIKTPYIALVNILAKKKIVPELIQSHFTLSSLVQEVGVLLGNTHKRDLQKKAFVGLMATLNAGKPFGQKVADIVATLCKIHP